MMTKMKMMMTKMKMMMTKMKMKITKMMIRIITMKVLQAVISTLLLPSSSLTHINLSANTFFSKVEISFMETH